MGLTKLVIRGARQHNLKNISLEIPRNTLTVITGLSGSGKSSLAFDTIYAEGQRRYVESLSAYARQFLDQMERPEVDVIEGLSPSIAIEQKTTTRSPRSTVGTITEIYDYLRVVYSTIGVPHCPNCGKPITRQSSEQIVQAILNGDLCRPDDRIMILAPIVRGRKGAYRKELEKLAQDGYVRVRIDGELYPLDSPPNLDKRKNHTIEVVVDRLLVKQGKSPFRSSSRAPSVLIRHTARALIAMASARNTISIPPRSSWTGRARSLMEVSARAPAPLTSSALWNSPPMRTDLFSTPRSRNFPRAPRTCFYTAIRLRMRVPAKTATLHPSRKHGPKKVSASREF